MKYLALLLIVMIVLAGCDSTSSVENPADTHFVRFYGQDGDQTGRDLVILPDGNLVLFGTTKPTTPTKGVQWYVAKVDPNGAVIWEREFGGLNDEEARDIELTSSNNLVLVGNTYKSPTDRDLMIITLTLDGVKIDSNTFQVRANGIPAIGADEDVATVTDLDTAFLIAGSSTATLVDTVTNLHEGMKVLVTSNLQEYGPSWVQLVGTVYDDAIYKIVRAPAPPIGYGSYYAFGTGNNPKSGNTSYKFWLFVLGPTGLPINVQDYLGTSSGNERISGFDFGSFSYILSGVSTGAGGASDLYVVNALIPDATGWRSSFDKTLSLNLGTNLSGRTAVISSRSGNDYYVLGEEASFDNNQNWVLTKIQTNNGNIEWSSPIIFGGQGMDDCGGIQETADGRLMIIGTMRTGRPDAGEFKMTLIKVNKDGKFE